ncbi:MAG TPA: 2,3-bisphosphoglycerate-independent phosphoglycerate mutase [Gemmatimonadaceae bacterium]|nr:2,3-bisphosphoglycerate-independent phosphoglycerate mutase [Gemmatimonadaceae bacterium]
MPVPHRARKTVILAILDGWGWREEREANAVALANAPEWRKLRDASPHTLLSASGRAVGLPDGQMGNSEVGHLNLGAGRVVLQDLPRISIAIEDGSFFRIPQLTDACDRAKNTALHLVGLVGNGGVHAHDDHLVALTRLAADRGVKRVFVHALLDGRDTPPRSGLGFMEHLLPRLQGTARIASIGGRYFGMDRDKRWERTKKWYDSAVLGTAPTATDPLQVIRDSYAKNVTDEFVEPMTIVDGGKPVATFADGDSVITWNFRSDRMRQIVRSLTDPAFDGFQIAHRPKVSVTTMTEYDQTFTVPIAFPPQNMKNVLGPWLAQHGCTQYRTAETEKYGHVTYFFNGGIEPPNEGEDRVMVPSPKVATYDLQPEMSAVGVTDKLCPAIESGAYDFVLVNYANGDMVGHTGSLPAAIKAVETVDACVARVAESARKVNATLIVTADHGNCEVMVDPVTKQPHTSHTTNLVPFFIVGDPSIKALRDGGALCDVAPTVLGLLGIQQPAEMTGTDLRNTA